MNSEATQILDDLLSTLETKLDAQTQPQVQTQTQAQIQTQSPRADAIAAVLAEAPRTTAVVSLREAPAITEFRQALTDGLIRVDTANRLLRLINEIVVRLVP